MFQTAQCMQFYIGQHWRKEQQKLWQNFHSLDIFIWLIECVLRRFQQYLSHIIANIFYLLPAVIVQ